MPRLTVIEHDISDLAPGAGLQEVYLLHGRWPVEMPSKRCWEHIAKRPNMGVLALRSKAPTEPPWRDYVLHVLSEYRDSIDRVERILRKYGAEDYADRVDPSMNRAIALRRLRVGATMLARDGKLSNMTRRSGPGGGFRLDHDGRVEPHRRPQG